MLAIKSDTSGFPVSAEVASIARLVTEATVALSNLISPAPGSAIVVLLSNVYFHAKAPTDAVVFVSDVLAALADVLALLADVDAALAEVAALVAEVDALLACVVAVEAEEVADVADEAAEVAELPAAVAELPALVSAVSALVSRSEERRVGKECDDLCRSRWSPYH
jgi:hypothetical protein